MKRERKVFFLKISDIWYDFDEYDKDNTDITLLHTVQERKPARYDLIISGKTFLLDLTQGENELLKNMEYKSCRYAINKSTRDGIIVKHAVDKNELEEYLNCQNEFCRERGFAEIRESDLKKYDICIARSPDGEFLGGCAFLADEKTGIVRYKHSATSHKYNTNEAIIWYMICDYKSRGYCYLDLGGVIPTDDKKSYYWRHYHFKKKWGGYLVNDYTYVKARRAISFFLIILKPFVRIFFNNNYNDAINWINKLCTIR